MEIFVNTVNGLVEGSGFMGLTWQNGLMILLCAWIVPAFHIDGFWSAMLYSVVLGVVSWVLNLIFKK